ncbi:hypothetical protein ElyMa_004292100 [Elysia marginata]|uniref:Uncharacterized protein n=1 Tax=Elysia marginata TaxID=1093978 RepID=A0AAV4GXV1_9GAST|nr:hypothetical protein ElyMa_004292100 [Elysia marginata]
MFLRHTLSSSARRVSIVKTSLELHSDSNRSHPPFHRYLHPQTHCGDNREWEKSDWKHLMTAIYRSAQAETSVDVAADGH